MESDDTEEKVKTHAHIMASIGLSPLSTAAHTACLFSHGTFGDIDKTEAVGVLVEQVAQVLKGDMRGVESMLVAQALALNTVFTEMMRRAAIAKESHANLLDIYMRMALKAQAQCRATLETLAEVKNPRVTNFVQQQNNAHQQQITNAATVSYGIPLRAEKYIQSNELLSGGGYASVDGRRKAASSKID